MKIELAVQMASHFFVTADVTPNKTQNKRLKVALSRMFLKRKKPHLFEASSCSKFHHTRRKNPFAKPKTVPQRAKRSLCNRSFQTLLLPHRFIKFRPSHQRPVNIAKLNFSLFVGFQNSPNLSKIEKVAETCEFDGKEPLFFERTIAISIRVLGWSPYTTRFCLIKWKRPLLYRL